MIIDAHNHADVHGHDVDKFIQNMDECHIDKTWLFSSEIPGDEYYPASMEVTAGGIFDRLEDGALIPFAPCLAYKERFPDRFILGHVPDPRRPEAISVMKAAVSIYNVQVCGEIKLRMMYDNPDAIDLYRFCGDAGLPVTMHFDYVDANRCDREFPRRSWWYGGGIDVLERVLELCPETNFLGHAPGFWGHISGDDRAKTEAYPKGPVLPGGKIEKLLEKYPNLYCDMSADSARIALSRDQDYTYKLMCRFPDRFLYARDYFDNNLQPFIESLGLPNEVKELVYHGNAERLIKK